MQSRKVILPVPMVYLDPGQARPDRALRQDSAPERVVLGMPADAPVPP